MAQEAQGDFKTMLRYNRNDNISVRNIRLGRDQNCYESVKWFVTMITTVHVLVRVMSNLKEMF